MARLRINEVLKEQFQFHKGTIKTENGWIYTADSSIFQFHKGTIKTQSVRLTRLIWIISIP